jgi:uncharacterized membrane protein
VTPLIATHAFAALTSLLLGGWQLFFSTKGSHLHRVIGRAWIVLMLYVSVSSFWITELRPGRFSLLHILSVVTIVSVSLGVWQVRRGNVRGHIGNLMGSYIGLCFAFVFAVALPARHIPQFVVTEPVQAVAAGLMVVITTMALIGAGRFVTRGDFALHHDEVERLG